MKSRQLILGMLFFLCVSCSLSYAATVSSDLLALTGNKNVKVVWSRYYAGNMDNLIVFGSGTYRLMTYSTTTDQVTDVLGSTGQYYRAKINHDGTKIIYNNAHDLYMMDWSGSNNHLIMKNAAICCYWYNTATSKEYAFLARGTQTMGSWTDWDPIYRVCLSDTTDKLQIQVTGSGYAGIWLSVSNDGTRLGGHFPWTSGAGGGGIYTLAANGTGTFKSFNVYGCWGMTPPDNSYRFQLYDVDTHNEWAVYSADGSGKHIVNIVPPGLSQGTYNARFSVNDPHYFTLIAPMGLDATGFNQSVGLYFGKLDDNITAVQGYVKIAGAGECMGHTWVDQGTAPVQPVLGASTSSLAFNATYGGSNPASKTVTITNTGTGSLSAVTAVSDTGWLTISGAAAGNTQTLTNAVNITNLAIGTHTAHVTVSGGGANNTVTYSAVLTIAQDPPHLASITLAPDLDSIGPNTRMFFTARCKDQRNNTFAAIINWSVSGGGTMSRTVSPAADSVDTSSFVSTGALGAFKIIVSNGQVRDTATIVVTSSLVYTISLLEPLGNKNYSIGDTMHIRWTASANIPGVVIHISLNDGMTWNNINTGKVGAIDRSDAIWGNFGWKIPSTIQELQPGGTYKNITTVSDKVLMEVRGYFDEANDPTPTAFSIKDGSATRSILSLNSNSGYPQIVMRNDRSITIKTNGMATVKIYDISGKIRRMIGMHEAGSCSIFGLQSGVYLVNIEQQGRMIVRPVRIP